MIYNGLKQHTRDIKGLQGGAGKKEKRKEGKKIYCFIVWVYGVWYGVEWWTV